MRNKFYLIYIRYLIEINMAVRKNKSANIYLNKVIHSVLFSVHIKFNRLNACDKKSNTIYN